MKVLTHSFCITLVLLIGIRLSAQTQSSETAIVSPAELQTIIGDWTGSLTYIDYGSGQPFTMPADLRIEQGSNDRTLILNNIFPNEPQANDSEKMKLSKGGMKINKSEVSSKAELKPGVIQVTTEGKGKDANKKAEIRHIYRIGPDEFNIIKEVRFQDSKNWLKRSEFSYTRAVE